jgi:hypothetical protein
LKNNLILSNKSEKNHAPLREAGIIKINTLNKIIEPEVHGANKS